MVLVVAVEKLCAMMLYRLYEAYAIFFVALSVTIDDETEFNERVVSHDCSWLSIDT